MKNLFAIVFTVSIFINSGQLKGQALKQGDNTLSLGYGFFITNAFTEASSAVNIDSISSKEGPYYFKYEYALTAYLSTGINVAYIHFGENYTFCANCGGGLTPSSPPNTIPIYYHETGTYTSWNALARLNLHLAKSKKVDPYCGLGLGYKYSQWKFVGDIPMYTDNYIFFYNSPVSMELTAGIRYFFMRSLSAYLEAGLAKSLIQTGLTTKF